MAKKPELKNPEHKQNNRDVPKGANKRVFNTALLSTMKTIIARYTDKPELLEGIEDLPDNTDINFIKELNIDSVDVVEIVVDVEEKFNITITDDEIHSFRSFGDMYDLIRAKLGKAGAL